MSGKIINLKDVKVEVKKISHLSFDDAFSDEPSLIDIVIRNAVKKRDELMYSLFVDYGYCKDEVDELIKFGVIEGDRTILSCDPATMVTYFYLHGEALFYITERFDPGTCIISVGYKKLKGERDV